MRWGSRTRRAGVMRRRAGMHLACKERQAGAGRRLAVMRRWWGLRFIVLTG
jgi:hypothetical protein